MPGAPVAERVRLRSGWRRLLLGLRARIVVGFVLLLALTTTMSVLVLRQVLITRLQERIDADLVTEITDLRLLAKGSYPDGSCVVDVNRDGQCAVGRDPVTGEPFGDDGAALFDSFLLQNLPHEAEAFLTFLDGELYRPSRSDLADALLDDRRFRELGRTTDDATLTGEHVIPDVGPVRYLAVPVFGSAGTRLGVLVVAQSVDVQRADVDEATRAAALTSLVMVAVSAALAFLAADRILAPVRTLTRTARSISEGDLTRRIEVRGTDELSELTRTFNDMLDRIEQAFAGQRDFINDASHELRTPITIIRGHLELLSDDPRERAETVTMLTDELDRMSRMVNDLLMLAKSERPDFLALEAVDVDELVLELHEKAMGLAPRRWLLVEPDTARRILADRQRVTQAVMQLAQNAVQHTTEGDEIELGVRADRGVVRFRVRDTGPGVASQDVERIFDRFARAAADRRRSDGAGLGLAIVRVIAEAHGGVVELQGRPGRGAVFTLALPEGGPPQYEATSNGDEARPSRSSGAIRAHAGR